MTNNSNDCNHKKYTLRLIDDWGQETVYMFVCDRCGETWYERVEATEEDE